MEQGNNEIVLFESGEHESILARVWKSSDNAP